MATELDYTRVTKRLDELKTQYDQERGAMQATLKQIQELYPEVETLADAERILGQLKETATNHHNEFTEALNEFRQQYNI